MTTVDRDVISRHLQELEEVVRYLKSKRGISERDLFTQYELRLAIERAFHLAIQNTIDIGNHILALLNVRDVDTYADIPAKLADANIIQKPLALNLAAMARFRNLLVHEYVKIESKKLIAFLQKNLSDFETFAAAIVAWLKAQ